MAILDPMAVPGDATIPFTRANLVASDACVEGVAAYDEAIMLGISNIPLVCESVYPEFYIWCWEQSLAGFVDASFPCPTAQVPTRSVVLSGGVKTFLPVPDSNGIANADEPSWMPFTGTVDSAAAPALRSYDPAVLSAP